MMTLEQRIDILMAWFEGVAGHEYMGADTRELRQHIDAILAADRRGRELANQELAAIRDRNEFRKASHEDVYGGDDEAGDDTDALLAHIAFQAGLIHDLQSSEGDGSVAYQRGVEAGRQEVHQGPND